MNATRNITISLALALAALAPASALASHGADDNPALPDNHGAQQGGSGSGSTTTDDNPSVGDDHGGQVAGSDDNPALGDDHGGQVAGSDDNPALGDDHGGQVAGTDDNPTAGSGGKSSKSTKRSRTQQRVAGTCTGTSTSKLRVRLRDGRLKTEFEVDQNVAGVSWDITLRRNDTLAASATKTTKAPSGSLHIERRLRNGAGRDTISAEATSPSGEVCSATITI
jgi:hypothetical protein